MNIKNVKLVLSLIFVLFFISNGFAQTADEIIDKHIDAIGGISKIDSVKSQKVTGFMSMQGMDIPITIYLKNNEMILVEIYVQGMKILQGYDGKMGWMINPMTGSKKPEKMDDETAKSLKEEADLGGKLLKYKEKGYTAEFVGKEDMEGTDVYNIKITDKDGESTNFLIDAGSYLILKSKAKRKVMGKTVESETTFGNYKKIEGMVMPFLIESKVTGMDVGSQKVLIDKVEFNVNLDDEIFKMPAE